MKRVRITVTTVLMLLVGIFILQNWDPVSIRFLFWDLELPRLVLAGFLLLTGFVVGAISFSGSHRP